MRFDQFISQGELSFGNRYPFHLLMIFFTSLTNCCSFMKPNKPFAYHTTYHTTKRDTVEQGKQTISLCGNRELTLKCKFKCYEKPMKDPLGVSPSKGNQGTTRGKEKFLLTSVGNEPTTSGLDLPLLCRLSYEAGQRKSGTI